MKKLKFAAGREIESLGGEVQVGFLEEGAEFIIGCMPDDFRNLRIVKQMGGCTWIKGDRRYENIDIFKDSEENPTDKWNSLGSYYTISSGTPVNRVSFKKCTITK